MTIGETTVIYTDAEKTSYQNIKTSELYLTIGDTDILVCAVMDEHISYVDALKTWNVRIKALDPDSTIEKKGETSNDVVDDIDSRSEVVV